MGLMCNGYRLGFSPFRYRAGALVSIYTPACMPAALGGPGALRSLQLGTGTLTALPQGGNHPRAWMLPQKAGGMSSHNRCTVTVSAAGSGALGRNMQASATITIDASALGGLIAGGVGSATISITAAGDIVATIGAPGSATVSVGGSADPGAIGWLDGDAVVSVDGEAISYAIGHMTGTTEDLTSMTPAAVASAVWSAVAAEFTDSGSMGAKLNAASAGGVDLDALAAAVWAYGVRTLSDGGLSADSRQQLLDVWQRLGLDPAAPLTTTETSIDAGDVQQTVAEPVAGTVVVTRQ